MEIYKMHRPFLFLLCLGSAVLAQPKSFQVHYISFDAVFLDGGRDQGLRVSDTLQVQTASGTSVRLLVKFIADKSASCDAYPDAKAIKIGDKAVLISARPFPEAEKKALTTETKQRLTPSSAPKPRTRTRKALTGSVAVQMYHWDDNSTGNYDFNQPTMRLNLSARKLGGHFFDMQIRTRARYDRRRGAFTTVPQKEWRNRIYQCYIDYNNPQALLNFKLGRIISNPLSGIGYLDGLVTEMNLSKTYKLGFMGGLAPEWQYADFQTSIQKYGLYTRYLTDQDKPDHFETTLALAGEYHQSTVSREFVYWQNQYDWQKRLWLYSSMEMDLNRDWRKERTGQAFSLSNLYLNGNYEFLPWLSAGVNMDSRKNFWTYEYRTLADSLFDNLTRQGVRGQINLRLSGGHYIGLTAGMRKQAQDGQSTFSYTFSYNQNNLLHRHLLLNLYTAGFVSPFYDGLSSNVSLGKSVTPYLYLYLRYGNSSYQVSQGERRLNHQYQLNGNLNIGKYLYFNFFYEYDRGDDENGQRTWLELGTRL
jgi:hypothetical protein